jgi:hypothetical protein
MSSFLYFWEHFLPEQLERRWSWWKWWNSKSNQFTFYRLCDCHSKRLHRSWMIFITLNLLLIAAKWFSKALNCVSTVPRWASKRSGRSFDFRGSKVSLQALNFKARKPASRTLKWGFQTPEMDVPTPTCAYEALKRAYDWLRWFLSFFQNPILSSIFGQGVGS